MICSRRTPIGSSVLPLGLALCMSGCSDDSVATTDAPDSELGDDPHAAIWSMMSDVGVATLESFLRTSVVTNTCEGICDPD